MLFSAKPASTARIIGLTIVLLAHGISDARAAGPDPTPVTPELIAAAKKEGSVVWYGSEDLQLVTAVAKAFEAKYPGIKATAERSGAERNFQRISQEYASNIYVVDVVTSSNPGPILYWKRNDLLEPFVPEDVAKWPAADRDPEGYYAADCLTFAAMGYNSRLVKPEEAPKSFAELLDPKWKGKLVKAHPGYSGTIVTSTLALSQALGWDYFEKLGQQQILQVQSAVDPPRKVAQGERPVIGGRGRSLGAAADPFWRADCTGLSCRGDACSDLERRCHETSAAPERGPTVHEFPVLARSPADLCRLRLSISTSGCKRTIRTQALVRD